MSVRRPDFVIIGAQKAASTLLLHSLRTHPEAWLPADEDPFFRDPVYRAQDVERFATVYAGRPERRLGLKCPDYLARPEVPARLAEVLDVPDLVACLRDPVDRAVSAYFWKVRWGLLPVLGVEEGMRRLMDGGLRDHDPAAGEVLDWSLYGRHLAHHLQCFPREKVHVLVDTDLRRDPDTALNEVQRFLGIAERGVGEVSRRRRNEGVYSLPRLRLNRPRAHLLLRWDGDYGYLERPAGRLGRAAVVALAGLDAVLLARLFDNARPALSPGLERELREYFADDVRAVERLLDRDLGWGPREVESGTEGPRPGA